MSWKSRWTTQNAGCCAPHRQLFLMSVASKTCCCCSWCFTLCFVCFLCKIIVLVDTCNLIIANNCKYWLIFVFFWCAYLLIGLFVTVLCFCRLPFSFQCPLMLLRRTLLLNMKYYNVCIMSLTFLYFSKL